MRLVFLYGGLNWIQVTAYTVTSPRLPQSFIGFKILQISDLHSKSFGTHNQTLVTKIQQLNPDIIVATGDMLNSTNDRGSVFLDLAEQLAGSYPVYYVEGNHEQIAAWKARESRSAWYQTYLSGLEKAGIIIREGYRQLRWGSTLFPVLHRKDPEKSRSEEIQYPAIPQPQLFSRLQPVGSGPDPGGTYPRRNRACTL